MADESAGVLLRIQAQTIVLHVQKQKGAKSIMRPTLTCLSSIGTSCTKDQNFVLDTRYQRKGNMMLMK